MENTLINFTQQILQANYIPIHRITLPCAFTDTSWLDLGLRKMIFQTDVTNQEINQWLQSFQPHKVYHLTDDFQCNYTVLHLSDSEELFICGPFLFEKIRSTRFTKLCNKLKIPNELHNQLWEYYYHITFFPGQTLYISIFAQLAEWLFGKGNYETIYTNAGELDDWYQNYTGYFRIPDKPFMSIQIVEDRYELEHAIMDAVENANEEKAVELASKCFTTSFPPRMSNELRDQKDYAITLNTLLRKCTEHSGVHPIHIDCYSNHNIQLIEQLTSIDQCQTVILKMIRGYCRLIRKYTLKNYSLLTSKIITYVDTDLCADLSLKTLSKRLSVNASYLSTLFSKEMGMPLTEFVNHRRIEHAQKLLLTTDMPIKSVALKCGLSDVYYFSRLFKRITGTTPKVYRETATYREQELSIFRVHRAAEPI